MIQRMCGAYIVYALNRRPDAPLGDKFDLNLGQGSDALMHQCTNTNECPWVAEAKKKQHHSSLRESHPFYWLSNLHDLRFVPSPHYVSLADHCQSGSNPHDWEAGLHGIGSTITHKGHKDSRIDIQVSNCSLLGGSKSCITGVQPASLEQWLELTFVRK